MFVQAGSDNLIGRFEDGLLTGADRETIYLMVLEMSNLSGGSDEDYFNFRPDVDEVKD